MMQSITSTKIGIITAIVMILSSILLFYAFHLPENGKSQYVVLCLFIAGVVWALYHFRAKSPTGASFKAYFSEGFKAFIVVTLFMVLFTFVFYKLNPQILEKAIVENNELVLKEGNRTQAEVTENANKLRSIFMPMMLAITTIKFLFLGALVTVVSAGFLSQKSVR